MPKDTLGEFERLVMLAVLHAGDDAYGAPILKELEERTGRSPSAGAVYVALRRLEEKGMLSSERGESTPGRGGRPKRYYAVEPAGRAALREARDEWNAMLDGIEGALETDG